MTLNTPHTQQWLAHVQNQLASNAPHNARIIVIDYVQGDAVIAAQDAPANVIGVISAVLDGLVEEYVPSNLPDDVT